MVIQQNPFDQLKQNNLRYRQPYQQQTKQNITPTEQTTYTHHNPYEEKFHSEFSFVALILGIFGLLLPLFSTLAVIFGIGGLMQTHREHMKGRWMAVTGIILGFLGIILVLVAILFGIEFLQTYLLRFGGLETLIGKASNYVG
jgi:hypothetical protein